MRLQQNRKTMKETKNNSALRHVCEEVLALSPCQRGAEALSRMIDSGCTVRDIAMLMRRNVDFLAEKKIPDSSMASALASSLGVISLASHGLFLTPDAPARARMCENANGTFIIGCDAMVSLEFNGHDAALIWCLHDCNHVNVKVSGHATARVFCFCDPNRISLCISGADSRAKVYDRRNRP